jgi:hypothetical protein
MAVAVIHGSNCTPKQLLKIVGSGDQSHGIITGVRAVNGGYTRMPVVFHASNVLMLPMQGGVRAPFDN